MVNRNFRVLAGFVIVLAFFATPAVAVAEGALHIVLVIDTNASKRGGNDEILRGGMNANLKSLLTVFNEVRAGNRDFFTQTRMRVYPPLKDDDVSPGGIRKMLSRLHVNHSDRVLFYSCSHGAWDREKGHYLATSGGDITRNEIRDMLVKLNPTAAFIVTECCSSYAEFTPPERKKPAKWRVFRKLFYETEGIVDFTAASEGEIAWTNRDAGGFFTQALVKYLCESAESIRREVPSARPHPFASREPFADKLLSPSPASPGDPFAIRKPLAADVSWDDFFASVKDQTKEIFTKAKAKAAPFDEIKKEDGQTPYAFRLGGWPRQRVKRLVVENRTDQALRITFESENWNPIAQQWGKETFSIDVKPDERILLAHDGLPICARSFVYKAVSLTNPNISCGEKMQAAPEDGYEGRMRDYKLTLFFRAPADASDTP